MTPTAGSGRPLEGRTIGVLQSRHNEVLAELIRKRGGEPLLAPTLKEIPADARPTLEESIATALEVVIDIAIFQTGVGAAAIFDAATSAGLDDRLQERLAAATVVVRGPKPASALRKHGVRIDLRTAEPHTTAEVIALLDRFWGDTLPAPYTALLQHYGARNSGLVRFLEQRGASVVELAPYRWALPDDLGPVLALLDALEAGRIDSVVFTSAAQADNLFAVASDHGGEQSVSDWLRERTVVAA
ncbi:MAG TPA: uroporphyrinogen-III synthase, partial [Candidatus Sulfotelmatobacter sp.]|nr:uroporphyrinogen-III synthase [Candidatus Sulfotelmatobacter sp.]